MLSLPRILAASLVRRGATTLDDALSGAAYAAVGPLDRLRDGVTAARGGLVLLVGRAACAFTDATGILSGVVSGCDCTDDEAEGCTRDGHDRACGCVCHTALGMVCL